MKQRLFYCTDCGDFHPVRTDGRCDMCGGARILDPDHELSQVNSHTAAALEQSKEK